jgi:Putative beta-barrel porin-2, OmpL-like. bbp2
MKWKYRLVGSLATLLLAAVTADAQEIPPPATPIPPPATPVPRPAPAVPQPEQAVPQPATGIAQPVAETAQPVTENPQVGTELPQTGTTSPGPDTSAPGYGLEAESLPGELQEDIAQPPAVVRFGPTPVSQTNFLMDYLRVGDLLGDTGIRTFGWVEGGYTGASTGRGILSVETRQNRFGDEFLLNQIGWVIEKPLQQDTFNLGFMMRYFAGADAALGAAKGGIDSSPNPHFGQDFRDLYLSAHFPILTEGGMDFKIGRMNTIIGYNGFLAPYRPFYSSDYQFFYSQDGAFTGWLTDLHVSKRLDVWNGMTLGANTFFVQRSSRSICYIGQVNYWVTDEKKTRLTASVYAGPNAIFAAPKMAGDFDTTIELRLQQNWSPRFTQIIQNNMGWDANTPVGTGSWYGLYTIGIFHLNPKLDTNFRAEWFDDVKGTRTGINTNYAEVTGGINWHPVKYLEIRPEIRGDFAGAPAFGVNGEHTHRSQLSGGISFLVKF